MTKYNARETLEKLKNIHNEKEIEELIATLTKERSVLDSQIIDMANFYSMLKNFPLSALPLLPEALNLNQEQHVAFVKECIENEILTLQKDSLACNALNLLTRQLNLQDCRSLYIIAHQIAGARYVEDKEARYLRDKELKSAGLLELLLEEQSIKEDIRKHEALPEDQQQVAVQAIENLKKDLASLDAKNRDLSIDIARFNRDFELSDISNPNFQIPEELKAKAEFGECEVSLARKTLQYIFCAVSLEGFLIKLNKENLKLPKEDILRNTEEYFLPSLHFPPEALPLLAFALDLNHEEKVEFLIKCAQIGLLSFAEGHFVMYKMTQDFSDEEWIAVKKEAEMIEFARIKKGQIYSASDLICLRATNSRLKERQIAENLCSEIKNGKLNLLDEQDWINRMTTLKVHFPINYLLEFCDALFPMFPGKKLEAIKKQESFVTKCTEIGILNLANHREIMERANRKFAGICQEDERIDEVSEAAEAAEAPEQRGRSSSAAVASLREAPEQQRGRRRSDAVVLRGVAPPTFVAPMPNPSSFQSINEEGRST